MEWSRGDPLPLWQRLAYGLGHVQYSLFAAMWFSYLLLYLQFVMLIPVTIAGVIFMLGQLCDGVGTPLIAYQADRLNWRCYGKRKTVHLVGTVVISLIFPFVFMMCTGCDNAPTWALVLYFVPLVALFQMAWASVMMSHLSLIPELTTEPKQRDELNIIRYGTEILAASGAYVIAYAVLNSNMDSLDSNDTIGPENAPIFTNIAMILTGIGVFFSVVFHVFTPEPRGAITLDTSESVNYMVWKDWFRVPSFYKVAILFSVSRVITNVFQTFIPLYLQESLRAPHYLIAIVPLVFQITGFTASVLVKPILHCVNKKTVFMVAATLAFVSSIWFAWDDPQNIRDGSIYAIAVFGGSGGSIMLVLSLSLAADLVGHHTTSGGFVYGCLQFADRAVNGITILAIQAGRGLCPSCLGYYRDVICYGVCFFTIVNLTAMLLLTEQDLQVVKTLEDPTTGEANCKLLENKKSKYGAIRRGFQLVGAKP